MHASALVSLSDVQPPSVYKSHILNGSINKLYIMSCVTDKVCTYLWLIFARSEIVIQDIPTSTADLLFLSHAKVQIAVLLQDTHDIMILKLPLPDSHQSKSLTTHWPWLLWFHCYGIPNPPASQHRHTAQILHNPVKNIANINVN